MAQAFKVVTKAQAIREKINGMRIKAIIGLKRLDMIKYMKHKIMPTPSNVSIQSILCL